MLLPGAGLALKLARHTKEAPKPERIKKWGSWDVADDGAMSLDGQDRFNVYRADGGIGSEVAMYRLVGNDVIESRLEKSSHVRLKPLRAPFPRREHGNTQEIL